MADARSLVLSLVAGLAGSTAHGPSADAGNRAVHRVERRARNQAEVRNPLPNDRVNGEVLSRALVKGFGQQGKGRKLARRARRQGRVRAISPMGRRSARGHRPARPSRSEIAQRAGIDVLVHTTRLVNLPDILRRGLRGGASGHGISRTSMDQIFLSASASTAEHGGYLIGAPLDDSPNAAILDFDTSSLDRSDYHVSPRRNQGVYHKGTSARADEQAQLERLFANIGAKSSLPWDESANEIVFHPGAPPISMKSLRSIWVAPGTKRATLALLRKEGIDSVNGRPILDVVVERP
jgi:hypothetical protein